ncbi:capsid protein [Porcine associated circular DNA virus-10]|nr:capsid protein [Porcine associated circular DNA virus-10]
MCAKPYAKTSKKFSRTKRTYKRYNKYRRNNYRVLSRRISSLSKRVAGEVCKFEVTPIDYQNNLLSPISGQTDRYKVEFTHPLKTIQSGIPWVMPLNWYYIPYTNNTGTVSNRPHYNGQDQPFPISPIEVSKKLPVRYNTLPATDDSIVGNPELQYRLKYIYINALFNASINSSENNTDGALRIVIIKDKQPTGGSATWYSENETTYSRGVFNSNRIDAQLNPTSVGRFKIMYDKTLRFNTINGYKPFKYFKQLSTIVRNNHDSTPGAQTNDQSPPIQRNAYYLMLFSDGLNFTYSAEPSTPAASFHLFNRIAYYNN